MEMRYFYAMKKGWLFLLLGIWGQILCGQTVSPKDSSLSVFTLSASGGFMAPIGSLGERYDAAYLIGGDVRYKWASNWLVGGSGHYFFGSAPKEAALLSNVLPLIAGDGSFPAVDVSFRGMAFQATVGKIIPFKSYNPNSGLHLQFGAGYTEYHNRISVLSGFVPQLEGDYLRGYDRLSAGAMFSQSVGYTHFSNSKTINFFVHLEVMQLFVSSLRGYQFDLGMQDQGHRLEWMLGVKAGWIIPFYPRNKFRHIEFRNP
jgi:hypothetical protein